MRSWIFAGSVVLFGTTGCASSAHLEVQLSEMRREIRSMRTSMEENNLRVERLEGRVTLLSLGKGGLQESPKTAVTSVVTPRKRQGSAPPGRALPVVRLNDKMTPGQSSEAYLEPGAIDDGSPPIVIKMGPDDGDRLSVDHQVLRRPDPVLSKNKVRKGKKRAGHAEIRAAYEIARAKLRVDNKPAKAKPLFERFLARYPNSRYASNSVYWLGECEFALGRPSAAMKQWASLSQKYPHSSKVPDAIFRSGEAALTQGQTAKGRKFFQQVRDLYPDSEAAAKASEKLRSL